MRFLLGLTGSIGMGKTTTAQILEDRGCIIWDADAAVHRLYALGGVAVEQFASLNADLIENGAVSRHQLKSWIAQDPTALKQIETIVHPLVQADRQACITQNPTGILVFDIPLLYETGAAAGFDAVATVYCDEKTQRARVLARGTMGADIFETIKAKQMPASEKIQLADYIIHTDTIEIAAKDVDDMLTDIRLRMGHA